MSDKNFEEKSKGVKTGVFQVWWLEDDICRNLKEIETDSCEGNKD